MNVEDGVLYAWRVGCVANLVSGIIATLQLGGAGAGESVGDIWEGTKVVSPTYLGRITGFAIMVDTLLLSHGWNMMRNQQPW